MKTLNRRKLLIGAASLTAFAPHLGHAQGAPAIHVLKDRNCGCCDAWVHILQDDGFDVTTENSLGTKLVRYKLDNGIPQNMMSCHTGKIGEYFIEGHVPPADIRRLLSERPDAVGLSVPDMPYGSPGMGPEEEREAYDVFLIHPDGSTEVFMQYEAA
ncbi:DUF411 domain-containing protein [Aliiroseovarius sp. F47248L]|uniref:DUF411 domain-containing protein n=1 Tax=Aliiroseovarius sp. F47248L TaxID=2926420 RepID=UPI001FF5AD5F|nr:DUF411 domain-containing protein [Aliiroseovarius sp. F47248L]MCK0139633.1 DUF411 domain-containing protein [Aliiroseovarius sp. F47248L]